MIIIFVRIKGINNIIISKIHKTIHNNVDTCYLKTILNKQSFRYKYIYLRYKMIGKCLGRYLLSSTNFTQKYLLNVYMRYICAIYVVCSMCKNNKNEINTNYIGGLIYPKIY